ncbi:MAG TPA: ATP-binding protein [Actinomycetes bacterium]|nr:ATP-binding protein [Actinomycetes bacterium]
MAERLRGWWRRRTLRARLTMLATLVVAVGLLAGSALLLVSLHTSLLAAVDDTARQQAADVAALVDSDRLPDPIPVASAGTVLVQVVDSRGRVRAASLGSDRAVSLLPPSQLADARDGRPRFMDGARIGEREPLRVIARPAGPAADPVTVIAAASFASATSSIHIVQLAVLIGVPLLLALVAGTAWATVGSTLRPVGELRQGAEEITGMGGSRRLPLPAAHDEIRRLAETLNRMLDRLEQAGDRQRSFVADAAHELRSPLAGMQAQLEVALRHPDPASWQQVAAGVLEDTLRLGRMVEDLLVLARLDDRQVPRPASVVGLGEVARQVVGRQLEPRVELRLEVAGDVHVRADAAALDRVVQNLLDNALRHAARRVEVSVRAEGALAVLVVADDGPGIPAADRQRVFERYARLDDARSRDAGGAGLGLAIVHEIVRAHQGEVTIDDGAGAGARLVVRLPATQPLRVPSGLTVARPRAGPG